MKMAGDVEIRAAGRRDIAAIDAMLARSYPVLLKPDYAPSVLVTALPLISRAQPGLITSGTYYVATKPDGTIVGAGGWTRAAPPGGNAAQASGLAHIRHVVTDHREIRSGIGGALMRHVISTAKADGIRRLECFSTLTAVPFYSAVGFVKAGSTDVQLRPGITFPAVAMFMNL